MVKSKLIRKRDTYWYMYTLCNNILWVMMRTVCLNLVENVIDYMSFFGIFVVNF